MTKEQFFGMYIGREITALGVTRKTYGVYLSPMLERRSQFEGGNYPIEECKLILRPLSSMTGEEKAVVISCISFKSIAYLIEHGFNIFEGVVPEDWYTYEKGESE